MSLIPRSRPRTWGEAVAEDIARHEPEIRMGAGGLLGKNLMPRALCQRSQILRVSLRLTTGAHWSAPASIMGRPGARSSGLVRVAKERKEMGRVQGFYSFCVFFFFSVFQIQKFK
jgi:hypothetical protein